jgi:hypothetical protein
MSTPIAFNRGKWALKAWIVPCGVYWRRLTS